MDASDDHALLKRLVSSYKTTEDFQAITNTLHDLTRVIKVTMPMVKLVTALHPYHGSSGCTTEQPRARSRLASSSTYAVCARQEVIGSKERPPRRTDFPLAGISPPPM